MQEIDKDRETHFYTQRRVNKDLVKLIKADNESGGNRGNNKFKVRRRGKNNRIKQEKQTPKSNTRK